MEKIDYYSVGTKDDIVISNSLLNKIDVDLGGSPLNFFNSLSRKFTPTSAMINGTLLHKWVEDESNFRVADFDMPSEMAIKWVNAVHEALEGKNEKFYPSIDDYAEKRKNTIIYQKNALCIYDNIKKEDKIIEKWDNVCQDYFAYLMAGSNDGKILMSKEQKTLLTDVMNSLDSKKSVKNIIIDESCDFSNKIQFKEREFYFTYKSKDGELVKCKSKIDIINVDKDEKTVTIIDFKTTSDSPYNAKNLIKYRKLYRQLAFYGLAVTNDANLLKEIGYENDGIWKIKFLIVFAETRSPFNCTAVPLDNTWIFKGVKEYKNLIEEVLECQKKGWTFNNNERKNGGFLNIGNYE